MDGWVVLDRLKHDPSTRHIPVHVISVDDSWQRGMKLGAFAFLKKPVARSRWTTPSPASRASWSGRSASSWSSRTTRSSAAASSPRSATAMSGHGRRHRRRGVGGAAGRSAFDCLVLDLGLPDMNGLELLETIKRELSSQDLRVIVYTGSDLTPEERRRLEEMAETTDRQGCPVAGAPGRQDGPVPPPSRGQPPPATRQTAPSGQQADPELGRQEGPDRRRRPAQHLRPDQQAGALGDRSRSGPRTAGRRWSVLRETPDVDLVLMDIMMPEMDGYETIRAIRERVAFRGLPIIALTAKAMKDDRQKCLEAGASDYLAKPVSSEQLLSMLRVWLHRHADGHGPVESAGRSGPRDCRDPSHRGASASVALRQASQRGRSSAERCTGCGRTRTWSPSAKVNVLLVDDQPSNLLALEAILGEPGLNLVRARSGEEALMRVLDADFAVILMDVQMPGMDGFEAAALIRERDRSQHTPDHLPDGIPELRPQVFQRLRPGGGRLPGQADRAGGPALEGGGLRRAVPEDRAGEGAGRPAPSRPSAASTSASWPRRNGAGRSNGCGRGGAGRSGSPKHWASIRRSWRADRRAAPGRAGACGRCATSWPSSSPT